MQLLPSILIFLALESASAIRFLTHPNKKFLVSRDSKMLKDLAGQTNLANAIQVSSRMDVVETNCSGAFKLFNSVNDLLAGENI